MDAVHTFAQCIRHSRTKYVFRMPFAARRREKSKFSAENYVCIIKIYFVELYKFLYFTFLQI